MWMYSLILILASSVVPGESSRASKGFEVWGSDQSNSAPGQSALGVKGGFIWIWDSEAIEQQLAGGSDAVPLPCTPNAETGPCNTLEVFPSTLLENDGSGGTGNTLGDEGALFGRLHGMVKDPHNRYVNANFFVKGGGYIGIIDVQTKEAVALFRVTEFEFGPDNSRATSRSVHMSFWTPKGDAILIANLHGKAVERINIARDEEGKITAAVFDKSGTIGLGQGMVVKTPASFFTGPNAWGNDLIGGITGSYDDADLGDLTPNGVCKENGCAQGQNGAQGGRANNLPICPISSSNGLLYTTLAGGGLLVMDTSTTPITIRGEYGNNIVYGAGCGGVETRGKMYLDSGISASGAGATQSMFAVWEFDDRDFLTGVINKENEPVPEAVYEDEGNTLTLGNQVGTKTSDESGQLPCLTSRRDSHGAAADPTNGMYVHVADRIQNVVEVFQTSNFARTTYSLTESGACGFRNVADDTSGLIWNDPAPDLMEASPDGKYLVIAFRGPAPVSVPHAAQGSCPGVGIVRIEPNGKSGTLVDVLRATNTIPDTVESFDAPGGANYTGSERADVHAAIAIEKLG